MSRISFNVDLNETFLVGDNPSTL